MILFRKSNSVINKIIMCYLLMLFSIFPCYLINETFFEVTFRLLLFCFLTVMVAAMYIILLLKKQVFYRKKFYRIDLCIFTALFYSIVQIIIHIFRNKGSYEMYLLISVVILVYYILSAEGRTNHLFQPLLMDLFLLSSTLIYTVLLVHFLAVPLLKGPIGLIAEEPAILRAFLILSSMVCILQYCNNRNIVKDRFYLLLAAVGFFLLLLQKDMISILLISMIFLIIPLLYLPTAELIRRDLIAAFIFFIIMSNMAFITNYCSLLQTEIRYDLKVSVYLDLLLAAASLLVISYWQRIPKEIPLDCIVMKFLQRVFWFFIRFFGVLLTAILFLGPLEGVEGRIGIEMIAGFSKELQNAVMTSDGTFGQVLGEYGILGVILAAITYSVIIVRLKRQYDRSTESAMLTVIAVMFMVQSFFYKQQVVTTPVYAVLLTFALFYKKNMEESNEKFKQVETNQQMVSGGSDCSIDVWNDSKCHGTTGGNPKNRG